MRRPAPRSSSATPTSTRTRASRPVFGSWPLAATEGVVVVAEDDVPAVPDPLLALPEPLEPEDPEPLVCGLGVIVVPLLPDPDDPELESPNGSEYCWSPAPWAKAAGADTATPPTPSRATTSSTTIRRQAD